MRAFGAELVLLDFSRGEYFGLDETGATIWRGLEAGQALGEIADALVERYEVARDVAYDDIVSLVTHMQAQSLVSF
ncbi:MAG TPA: PqqD family protein [Labilithrix sp.]|nr:PqqD family protein [Labilithrix sp.]